MFAARDVRSSTARNVVLFAHIPVETARIVALNLAQEWPIFAV